MKSARRLLVVSAQLLALAGWTTMRAATPAASLPSATASAGALDGVRWWTVPDSPNGLKPNQTWHAIGSTPAGDIFLAGADHQTNSALYRIAADSDVLAYVGDARSASERAKNWKRGETAQKFHTRPLWLDGRVYVATLDRSSIDDAYLDARGFHWYAFDEKAGNFLDLSASEPGGTATKNGGLVTIAADPRANIIYGADIPQSRIFRYDVAAARTTDLGRPKAFGRARAYSPRFMWVDSRGRLYFTAGNPAWGQNEDAKIFGHVHFYDAASGGFGERKDWPLQEVRAIEVGAWTRDRKHCFVADDIGRVYRFDDDGPAFSFVGKLEHAGKWVWSFHLSADASVIFFVTSGDEPAANALYEFDLATAKSRRLCELAKLHSALATRTRHVGYDAWDNAGRFYFASFPWPASGNFVVTSVDPVRLKAALGN